MKIEIKAYYAQTPLIGPGMTLYLSEKDEEGVELNELIDREIKEAGLGANFKDVTITIEGEFRGRSSL